MSNKMKVTPNDLGFNTPENHSEESKNKILQMIEAETNASRKVRFSSPMGSPKWNCRFFIVHFLFNANK